MTELKVISLGWGVQSFTLVAMVALGDLEQVDYAVHADTTHERSATYDFAKRWTAWLEERGVKVVTVKPDQAELIDKWGGVMIPAYTQGLIRRQCTGAWKIRPVRRYLQKTRNKKRVEQWLGITLDEIQRMKPANVKYIENRWPLIEKRMTRANCITYLQKNGLEVPQKSACVFCPFQNRKEWREVRNAPGDDFERAIKADKAIRKARPPHDLFVNVQKKPLDEIDFDNETDKGQLNLWDNECEGMCGV